VKVWCYHLNFSILNPFTPPNHPLNIYWIALLLAGLLEIGWPLGLKLADLPNLKVWGIVLALISMTFSGLLLWFSLKEIPIGTAYAIWTSIGAAGTFTIGVLVFGDPNIPIRWVGVALILLGVIFLKMG
jgi:quaternary ammonium compound-resistance protein SugE